MTLSSNSMIIMDNFMKDIFDRLTEEASRLSKCTMTSRDIQAAVRLHLPGDLAEHAISEGTKAFSKYMQSFN